MKPKEKGYAVYFASADEFSIEESTEDDAKDLDASSWHPTFSEAKQWAIDAVKHTSDGYRALLRSVRKYRKSDAC